MWKSEFKDCIQAIQAEYNDQLAKMTESTERRCQERISSMENAFRRDNTDSSITKTENKTLKSQLGDNKGRMADLQRENDRLRKELEDLQNRLDDECRQCEEDKDTLRMQLQALEADLAEVMHDLEGMKSHNLDLELEIACYRKLLEGEENSMKRIIEDQAKLQSEGGAQLAGIIAGGRGGSSSQTSKPTIMSSYSRSGGMSMSGGGGGGMSSMSSMSESTGMVKVSKSSKCAVTFAEVAQDGSFVRLENGSPSKDFDLSKWSITRRHPRGTSSFEFPDNFKLTPKQSLRIFAYSFSDDAKSGDLIADKASCNSWGTGNGEYTLLDDKANEKATSKLEYAAAR
ncbi:hypothetical protein DPMN_148574 [Dreissena polymorpha]|uniref:Uncharacterized protein n=1 Tax=Dreissena polymorpha TaxID=45954 RepID=A0A9D4FC52_DREPO|nr:hypothetical protein DPMN_148574 [Dreissena polymorpha]